MSKFQWCMLAIMMTGNLLVGELELAQAEQPLTATLSANRNRLIADWAQRMQYASACDGWSRLTCQQKGAFLTLTHRLQIYILANTNDSVLDHVTKLYGIAPEPGCGGDGNRIYFAVDRALYDSFISASGAGVKGLILDAYRVNGWGKSHDIAGPHDPFTVSGETIYGHPRGQVHFWDKVEKGNNVNVCKTGFGPNQTKTCIRDGLLFEIDQDYDIPHNSSTECTYTNRDTGHTLPGRQYYEEAHPYVAGYTNGPDYNWAPDGCPGAICGGCTTCGSSVVPTSCKDANRNNVPCTCGVVKCRNSLGEAISCPRDVQKRCKP